jgi:MarR family transcriptional regulator, temperature-dependent positive regulator of motility
VSKRTSSTLDRSPVHLLHRASQSVADLFARVIKSDLTPRQLAVLTAIARQEGCSQTDIVDQTGIDRSTVAEMVRRLVGKGLIERRRSKKDARAYVIKLSQDGHRVLKGAEPLARRVDDKVLHALGSRGGAFLDSLSLLAQRLEGTSKT